jgi:hypothetical protein
MASKDIDAAKQVLAVYQTDIELREHAAEKFLEKASLADPIFNLRVKDVLTRGAVELKIIKSRTGGSVMKVEAQGVAKIVHDAKKDPKTVGSAVYSRALGLAEQIAANKTSAAKHLLCLDSAELSEFIEVEMRKTAGVELSDSRFNDDVKKPLVDVLIQINNITSKNDPLVRYKSASEVAKLIIAACV